MFVAKFTQVSSDKFETDKNGNFPFIGEIMCGTATASLYNGTMFMRDGWIPNKLYACENVSEIYEGKKQTNVQIISEISIIEFMTLRKELGVAKLNRADATAPNAEGVNAEANAEEVDAEA